MKQNSSGGGTSGEINVHEEEEEGNHVTVVSQENEEGDCVVTTCIVLDEFDEGIPNMINSDLLVDSLDNLDDEDNESE